MTTYSDEIVCAPRSGNLYDVLELILDRGMVIDVFLRVSLVGIEILKIDARIVVASVDTYLRFAEACNRLDLDHDARSKTVPELFGGSVAGSVAKTGAKKTARSLTDKVKDVLSPGDDEDDAGEDYEGYEDDGDERADAERRQPARRSAQRREAPARRSSRSSGDRDDDGRHRSRPRRRAEVDG
ncbi:gas vesicle structural protein GvpA [Streptomyces sp. NPDC090306]|uniref:gas vesicle structural protein GvpA n=1 Tax=unclassified Streptomyces TaxID=2593676 RepID=UPI0036EC8C3C